MKGFRRIVIELRGDEAGLDVALIEALHLDSVRNASFFGDIATEESFDVDAVHVNVKVERTERR